MIKKYLFGKPIEVSDNTRVASTLGRPSLANNLLFQETSKNYINSIGNLAYGVLRFTPYTRWGTDVLDIIGISPDIDNPDYTDITLGIGHVGRGYSKGMKSNVEKLRIGSRHKVGPRKRHPYIRVTPSYKNSGIKFWNTTGNLFKNLGIIGLYGDIKLEVLNLDNVINNRNKYNDELDYIKFYSRPEYRKQGGKMNMLEFLKKGSGIHIKKKNRGKYFKSINKYVNV